MATSTVGHAPVPPPLLIQVDQLRAAATDREPNKSAAGAPGSHSHASSGARPKTPGLMLHRASSERELSSLLQAHLSKARPSSDVSVSMAAAIGVALQLTAMMWLFSSSTTTPGRVARLVSRLLPFSSVFSHNHPGEHGATLLVWALGALVGAATGALLWLLIVQLLLPLYTLHVKKRTLWPISCEAIRISDAPYRTQWRHWARAIDRNSDPATVEEEWGAMSGDKALRLMASYQESGKQSQDAEFICLRFFPTPPPANHSSWSSYFKRVSNQSAPAASASASTTTPLPPPFTPYPDLANLATPGPNTPWMERASSSASSSSVAPPPVAPDDTIALVFLTVLPHYDLRPHLPAAVQGILSLLMRPFVRAQRARQDAGTGVVADNTAAPGARAHDDDNVLWMRLGLIGFQFPFRTAVFFTKSLETCTPYARAFQRQQSQSGRGGGANALAAPADGDKAADTDAASLDRELRTARYALVLQVVSDWNQARATGLRADLLLHASASGSASADATHRAGMVPVPVPPSYVADLREWGGAEWSAYVSALRKQGKRVREAPFNEAKGRAELVCAPAHQLAVTTIALQKQVAHKQESEGGTGPTLLKPTVEWVETLLTSATIEQDHGHPQPAQQEHALGSADTSIAIVAEEEGDEHHDQEQRLDDDKAGGNNAHLDRDVSATAVAGSTPITPASPSSPSSSSSRLASILRLQVPSGIAASSVVLHLGPSLITSDVAGFDYPLLDELQRSSGRKIALYSVKLATVLRRAMRDGVAFADFGPTTGEAKRQVGCQTLPLHGAAICAQLHLLWLARAAATAVALQHINMPKPTEAAAQALTFVWRTVADAAGALQPSWIGGAKSSATGDRPVRLPSPSKDVTCESAKQKQKKQNSSASSAAASDSSSAASAAGQAKGNGIGADHVHAHGDPSNQRSQQAPTSGKKKEKKPKEKKLTKAERIQLRAEQEAAKSARAAQDADRSHNASTANQRQ